MLFVRRLRQKGTEIEKLPQDQRAAVEKQLSEAETANIRSQRSKISRKNFRSVKLIGRGAFGEVRERCSFLLKTLSGILSLICRSASVL